MPHQTYPVATIAEILNLTPRRVQQLVKEKIIPKAVHGEYELFGCIKGYIMYLQERTSGREVTTADAHAERTRLLKAQADKTELEVAQIKEKLLPALEVANTWSNIVLTCRAKLLTIPNTLANQLIICKKPQEIEVQLKEAIYEALNELASYNHHALIRCNAPDDEAPGTTTDSDGEQMGHHL